MKATGELAGLRSIGLAAKLVSNHVNRAAIANIIGSENQSTIYGERVQKLDFLAHNFFVNVLRQSIYCAGMVSEENEEIIIFNEVKK